MDEHRIARADIFFCGGFVAALMGCVMQTGFATDSPLVCLGALLLVPPIVGTLAALRIAGRPITMGPFLWTIVGAVGAVFLGLVTFLVFYDLLLIVLAPIASAVFLAVLVRSGMQDRRRWTRVVRSLLVAATAGILILAWVCVEPPLTQPVGAWLMAAWPLAGAAALAPMPWVSGSRVSDEAFLVG